MRAIEQACYWLARPRPAPEPPLAGDTRADVAIIGGGFTGLWTAIRLKELAPSADVLVLESECVGHGASGRNAGHVSGTLDHSHRKAIAHFGLDEARRMARVGLDNLATFEQFLAENAIDCGYTRVGQLLVALNDAHLADIAATVTAAEQLGLADLRVLSAAATRAELNSPLYRGGLHDPGWGSVDPVALITGLKTAALRRGARICEHTPVTRLEPGVVHTAQGRVTADRVVLATNAYSHTLFPRLLWRYLPLYDYIIVSDPLTAPQLAAIGWGNRQAVVDGRTFFNYYRLTADRRILWGGSEAVYYRGNEVSERRDQSGAHVAGLLRSFRRHFPDLADLKFPYAWGGPICSTTRLTPFFGKAHGGWLLYGLGYTGLGIANSHLAGQILAALALDQSSPLLELALVRRPPFPVPPEPLRSVVTGAVSRALRRVDDGQPPSLLLRALDRLGIGFSS